MSGDFSSRFGYISRLIFFDCTFEFHFCSFSIVCGCVVLPLSFLCDYGMPFWISIFSTLVLCSYSGSVLCDFAFRFVQLFPSSLDSFTRDFPLLLSTQVAQMEKQTQLYSLNSMDDVYGRGTEGSNPMYNPKRSRGIAATRTATNENYPERRREFSPNGRPRVGRKGNILAPEHNGKKKNNRQRSQKRNVCVSDGSSAHAVSGQRSAGDCTEIYEVYADDADKKRRGGRVKCREGAGWGVGIEGNGRAVRRSNDSGSGESEDEPAHAVPLRLQVANARGSQKLNIGKARTARAKLDQKNSSSGDDGGGGGSVGSIVLFYLGVLA